ncbi:MAG: transglutaminase-like cysteine peptidase [Mariprofundaceae bacterium]
MNIRPLLKLLFIANLLVSSTSLAADASFSPELLNNVERNFGTQAKTRMLDWQQTIYRNRHANEKNIISSVNDFFNHTRFISDPKHWRVPDYWATPVEFLATDGGDCEDYSIAKYFTLRELGIADNKLRITYVKALRLNQAHMVLAYYPRPDAEPLILDNLRREIMPASKRTDLAPVYSFNGLGLWVAKEKGAGYTSLGDPGRINFWRDLKVRMQQERQLGESYTRDNYNVQNSKADTPNVSGQ